MKQTKRNVTKHNSLQRILGEERYASLLRQSEQSKLFAQPLKNLGRDELVVAVLFLREALEAQSKVRAHVQADIREVKSLEAEVLTAMEGRTIAKKNPFKPGDMVRVLHDVRDSYSEVWHDKGTVLEVVSIHEDGNGLMFASQLGVHFTNVEPVN